MNTTSHMCPGRFGPARLLDLKAMPAAFMVQNSEMFFDAALTLRSSPTGRLSRYLQERKFDEWTLGNRGLFGSSTLRRT